MRQDERVRADTTRGQRKPPSCHSADAGEVAIRALYTAESPVVGNPPLPPRSPTDPDIRRRVWVRCAIGYAVR